MSWLMLTFSSSDDTQPPHRPGFDALLSPACDGAVDKDLNRLDSREPNLPSTAIPSRHQEIVAGGLLELESQISVASMPGFSSGGMILIFTVSGGTEHREKGGGTGAC